MLHRYLSLLTSEPISKLMSSPGMRDLNRSGAHDAGDPLEHPGTLSLGTCYGQNEYFFRFLTMALFAWFFLGFSSHSRIFHSYYRWRAANHYRWRAANFDLYSAIMTIEQWELFSLPHLLWHGAFIYYGQLRGPSTHTPVAQRLAVELSLPI